MFCTVSVEFFRDKLWAIIHSDGLRRATRQRDLRHRVNHLLALVALVDVDRQRLAGERIDDRQHLLPPAVE